MSDITPHSPSTSSRRRRSSGFSITTLNRPNHSRKSSIHSVNSPYRPSSALDRSGDYAFGRDFAVPEGLDSLAAELAEEDWDEEEELVDDDLEQVDSKTSASKIYGTSTKVTPLDDRPNGTATKHHEPIRYAEGAVKENNDEDIDGSKVISLDLEDQIKLVETLAKQNIREEKKELDIFSRVTKQLQDLGSQARVEDQAARLTNAVRSLDTHLSNESRQLQILLQPYISPFAPPPDPNTVEALQPLIAELIDRIPAPPTTPLPAIHGLNTSGIDVLSSLAVLSDNLYIAQQNTSLATQRLRSSRDVVDTIRKEIRLAEEGDEYLQSGSWESRLRKREAASICTEVVSGFEDICNSWRRRLYEESAVSG